MVVGEGGVVHSLHHKHFRHTHFVHMQARRHEHLHRETCTRICLHVQSHTDTYRSLQPHLSLCPLPTERLSSVPGSLCTRQWTLTCPIGPNAVQPKLWFRRDGRTWLSWVTVIYFPIKQETREAKQFSQRSECRAI